MTTLLTRATLLTVLLSTAPLSAQTAEDRLATVDASIVVGERQGDETEIIGLVEDGYVGEEVFALVDSRMQRLRLYDFQGNLLHGTGGSGRGPGEFYVLAAVTLLEGDRPLVFDQGNRRLSLYSNDLSLVEEFSVPGLFSDFCSMDGRVFLQGIHEGMTIHELSLETGELVQSFGDLPELDLRASPGLVESALQSRSDAALVCDAENAQVIEVHRSTPRVTAFTVDGRERWTTELDDYREVGFQVTDRGGLAIVPDPETESQHFLAATSPFDDNLLVVQHAVLDFENREIDEGDLTTWVLDRESGTIIERNQDMPRLLHAASGTRLFGSNLPWPQVRLVRSTPEKHQQ
ncbi:MAG: hypothetical protein U5R14_06080 [Gemmatimonadota bacterium]|nr:hypothetical protein [Gemmatimonadota bacterium]